MRNAGLGEIVGVGGDYIITRMGVGVKWFGFLIFCGGGGIYICASIGRAVPIAENR